MLPHFCPHTHTHIFLPRISSKTICLLKLILGEKWFILENYQKKRGRANSITASQNDSEQLFPCKFKFEILALTVRGFAPCSYCAFQLGTIGLFRYKGSHQVNSFEKEMQYRKCSNHILPPWNKMTPECKNTAGTWNERFFLTQTLRKT